MKKSLIPLILLISMSNALAQPKASQPITTTVMNKDSKAPSTAAPSPLIAFFYQKPEVLDRDKHKDLRIQASNAGFASKSPSVPLVASEFAQACLEYPIVFSRSTDGQWMALALTSVIPGANAFVNAQGQWQARYVPASVQRYPFILAESGNDQLSLAVDMAAPHVGKVGEAIFDAKGEPSEFIKQIMPVLANFQAQAKLTNTFIQQLETAGLLTSANMQVNQGPNRSAVVEGVWIVDETKLRALSDDKALAWFKSGELALIHAHMLSLRNLVVLLDRIPANPVASGSAPEPSKAPAAERNTPAAKATSK